MSEIVTLIDGRLLLSITEACRITGLGRSTLYAEIKAGRLVARKYGRRTLIAAGELARWIETFGTLQVRVA
jgi:excisionase family DNA binding protein